MQQEGWVKIHRKLKDHWLWKDANKLKWWLEILMDVNHTEKKINFGNEIILCKRGQSIKSLSTWAMQLNTSKDSIRNYFKLLAADGMILHESYTKFTRITVCNYDSYQSTLHDNQTETKQNLDANQTPPIHKQESKELKESKEYINIVAVVDCLNNLIGSKYSPKTDKTQKSISARLNDYSVEDIKNTIAFKVKKWKGTDMEKYLRPETLFIPSKFESYYNEMLLDSKISKPYWAQFIGDTWDARKAYVYGQKNKIPMSGGGRLTPEEEKDYTKIVLMHMDGELEELR